MLKVAIAGIHGAGKSILIQNMIDEFKKYKVSIYHVKEVARECPYQLGTIKSQRWIWKAHINEEIKAKKLNYDIILCDRTLLDNLLYYKYLLNQEEIDPVFVSLWNFTIRWMNTYDYISVLDMNLEFIKKDINDTLRIKDEDKTIEINKLFIEYLKPYQNININRFNYKEKILNIINQLKLTKSIEKYGQNYGDI